MLVVEKNRNSTKTMTCTEMMYKQVFINYLLVLFYVLKMLQYANYIFQQLINIIEKRITKYILYNKQVVQFNVLLNYNSAKNIVHVFVRCIRSLRHDLKYLTALNLNILQCAIHNYMYIVHCTLYVLKFNLCALQLIVDI